MLFDVECWIKWRQKRRDHKQGRRDRRGGIINRDGETEEKGKLI